MALQYIPIEQMQNWSIGNILQETLLFNSLYPQMPLSKLLVPVSHPVRIMDNEFYQQVTVKSGGEGMEKRYGGYKLGLFIKTKSQNRLESGLLVLSRIDARNGAFAIVPQELEGAIVTKDFPSFRINESIVRPQYLQLLLSSDAFTHLLEHGSKGTTNRKRVEMDYLLSQQIPVPTLVKQDELLQQYNQAVAFIADNAIHAVDKAAACDHYFNSSLGLRESEQATATPTTGTGLLLMNSASLVSWNVETAVDETLYESSKYPVKTLSDMDNAIILLKRGERPRYAAQSAEFILNQRCVRWDYIEPAFAKPVDAAWSSKYTEDSKTAEGDIMINSTGEGTIGRSAVVDAASSHKMHDSHVLLLRVNPAVVNSTYLSFVINSHYGQTQIERLKSAKTTKQTELGVGNLLKLIVPLPPLAVQAEIVAQMITMKKEIRALTDTERIKADARFRFSSHIFQR